MVRAILHAIVITLLTLATQIGGIAYLLTFAIVQSVRKHLRPIGLVAPVVFLLSYVGLSVISAYLAPLFGRVPLPCFSSEHLKLAMQSPLYCALNRHYVRPELRSLALRLAENMDQKYPGTVTLGLDANFPFIDGFPLLPHLSHDDGRKLDLAYFYQAPGGAYVRGETKSPIGYWAFETPAQDSALPCADRRDLLTMRWDMKWLRPFMREYDLEESRTRAALDWLTSTGKQAGVSKIFLEPHLVKKLNAQDEMVRFQGCRAARHDDHIHLEMGRQLLAPN